MTMFRIDRRETLAGLATTALFTPRVSEAGTVWRWGVDYGAATKPAIARQFDLLVLEPDHARPIAPLRGPGSLLLGYISLGEVEQSRSFVDRLRKAGALKAANPHWPDARMIDLRNPAWGALVVDELIPAILAKGYDGVFFDTLDNAEALEHKSPEDCAGMVAAAIELVALIRKRFPSITLMMNRGYALLPQAALNVDIILAESMASRWSFADKRYEFLSDDDWAWQAAKLQVAKDANPAIKLTTLDYWDPSDHKTIMSIYERERSAGYLPYVATLALDRLHPEPVA